MKQEADSKRQDDAHRNGRSCNFKEEDKNERENVVCRPKR